MAHPTTDPILDADGSVPDRATRSRRESGPSPRRRAARGRRTGGFRRRILFRYVVLLSITLVVSILVTRSILLARVDDRIQARLVKEVGELQLFANNAPPLVQKVYDAHVRELFGSLLAVDPPGPSESNVTFVNGQLLMRTPDDPPYPLEQDPALVAQWSAIDHPTTGGADTPAGPIAFRAEPVTSADGSRGVYVVAVFRNLEQHDVDQATLAAVIVAFVALIVGSILAWTSTGRMLRPVAAVTSTARSISESDLTRRLPVQGDEEIATLAATFNDLLDRMESAFTTQRAFLDDAGHELRTPITVITGQLELLEDDPIQRQATITLVMGELDRMARIVNDLLLLAKAQQPDLLRLDTVDVAPLIEQILEKARSLSSRGWELESVGHGVIVADKQRLTEGVMQLAENAVKHTTDGDLFLGSSVSAGFARFWVRDKGPGLPPREQERIFARFSKAKGHPRREGAGLGLAIVRAIAEAHHGGVEVESKLGEGSKFTITVPVDQPLPVPDEDGEAP
jgi:signal transduction histidine kinase